MRLKRRPERGASSTSSCHIRNRPSSPMLPMISPTNGPFHFTYLEVRYRPHDRQPAHLTHICHLRVVSFPDVGHRPAIIFSVPDLQAMIRRCSNHTSTIEVVVYSQNKVMVSVAEMVERAVSSHATLSQARFVDTSVWTRQ